MRLQAALAFAVGSVRACVAHLRGPGRRRLPERLAPRLALDDHRYGWYIDRRAFGPDLYIDGRSSPLPLATGGTVMAQKHLETCWAIARDALAADADASDLHPADRMVGGDLPLPSEQPVLEEIGSAEISPSSPSNSSGGSWSLAPDVVTSWQR